eukprot:4799502-Alexandrium_andersonii.AAC.1
MTPSRMSVSEHACALAAPMQVALGDDGVPRPAVAQPVRMPGLGHGQLRCVAHYCPARLPLAWR